jgi:predicted nuclease of predicted toxin-antitoxin system
MRVWLDAQLPPALARWMRETLGLQATALRELGLRDAADTVIFAAAREAGVILVSKDSDFVDLVQRFGPPPQLVWLTCGNLTNANLTGLFARGWPLVATILTAGEPVVELSE